MRTTLIVFLCVTAIGFESFAGIGGERRSSGEQAPDETAARALQQAISAYRDLELQQQQLAKQEVALQEQKHAEEAARQQAIQDRLQELQQDASQKLQEAEEEEMSVQNITKRILQDKKLIPVDPWREIHGETEYVKSSGTDFVKFSGEILQITTNAVLIEGSCGTGATNFYVEHFPTSYHYSEGYNLSDGEHTYVAVPDGTFTYVAIDGSIRSIPQLDYGIPCSRLQNAGEIEKAAQEFTYEEKAQIADAKNDAENKKKDATAASTALAYFIQEIKDERNAELQARNAPQAKALQYDQDKADNGDAYGLLRMGERYSDGEGVTKDLDKAREYLTKAANAGSITAAQELKNLNQPANLSSTSNSK